MLESVQERLPRFVLHTGQPLANEVNEYRETIYESKKSATGSRACSGLRLLKLREHQYG